MSHCHACPERSVVERSACLERSVGVVEQSVMERSVGNLPHCRLRSAVCGPLCAVHCLWSTAGDCFAAYSGLQ